MEKMKELNPEQYKYVVKLPRHRWATHCFLEGCSNTYAEKILGSSRETSRFYTLNPSTDVLFQVIAADRTDVVDLSKKTCSCKRWDIDGIPCNHAMAAISFRLRIRTILSRTGL
ncbi:hypothetical protein ACMD2_20958 [Ananas comosus]|uniref:SWIM-type domain-containing protein n=1 Tax=Ananas comosus TaxID=4615 RepID=A0A199URX1_ANACO|nr:hypothetical protein ACMD2_20958 [Ananas comosus]